VRTLIALALGAAAGAGICLSMLLRDPGPQDAEQDAYADLFGKEAL
jgi:hypothetical protein